MKIDQQFPHNNSIKKSANGTDVSFFLCGVPLDRHTLELNIVEGSNPISNPTINALSIDSLSDSAELTTLNIVFNRNKENSLKLERILVQTALHNVIFMTRSEVLSTRIKDDSDFTKFFEETIKYVGIRTGSSMRGFSEDLKAELYLRHAGDIFSLMNTLTTAMPLLGGAKLATIRNALKDPEASISSFLTDFPLAEGLNNNISKVIISEYYGLITGYFITFLNVLQKYVDDVYLVGDHITIKNLFFLNIYKFTSLIVAYGMPNNFFYNDFENSGILTATTNKGVLSSMSEEQKRISNYGIDYEEYVKIGLNGPRRTNIRNDQQGSPIGTVKTLYSLGNIRVTDLLTGSDSDLNKDVPLRDQTKEYPAALSEFINNSLTDQNKLDQFVEVFNELWADDSVDFVYQDLIGYFSQAPEVDNLEDTTPTLVIQTITNNNKPLLPNKLSEPSGVPYNQSYPYKLSEDWLNLTSEDKTGLFEMLSIPKANKIIAQTITNDTLSGINSELLKPVNLLGAVFGANPAVEDADTTQMLKIVPTEEDITMTAFGDANITDPFIRATRESAEKITAKLVDAITYMAVDATQSIATIVLGDGKDGFQVQGKNGLMTYSTEWDDVNNEPLVDERDMMFDAIFKELVLGGHKTQILNGSITDNPSSEFSLLKLVDAGRSVKSNVNKPIYEIDQTKCAVLAQTFALFLSSSKLDIEYSYKRGDVVLDSFSLWDLMSEKIDIDYSFLNASPLEQGIDWVRIDADVDFSIANIYNEILSHILSDTNPDVFQSAIDLNNINSASTRYAKGKEYYSIWGLSVKSENLSIYETVQINPLIHELGKHKLQVNTITTNNLANDGGISVTSDLTQEDANDISKSYQFSISDSDIAIEQSSTQNSSSLAGRSPDVLNEFMGGVEFDTATIPYALSESSNILILMNNSDYLMKQVARPYKKTNIVDGLIVKDTDERSTMYSTQKIKNLTFDAESIKVELANAGSASVINVKANPVHTFSLADEQLDRLSGDVESIIAGLITNSTFANSDIDQLSEAVIKSVEMAIIEHLDSGREDSTIISRIQTEKLDDLLLTYRLTNKQGG